MQTLILISLLTLSGLLKRVRSFSFFKVQGTINTFTEDTPNFFRYLPRPEKGTRQSQLK